MEENKIKKIFRIGILFFIILLLLCCLKIAGFFNFFYYQRLEDISDRNINTFNNFINDKVKIAKTISGDTLIQSSLIQHDYRRQLIDAYRHLTLYKQNFSEIRNITLFNSVYEIVIAGEIDESIVNKNLNEWFLNSSTRGYYISEISYANKYNEFVVSIIYTIKNIIDENIGFLMVDFSLSMLFDKFDEFKNTVVILKKQDKFIFTYPLGSIVKKEKDLKRFPKIIQKSYNGNYKFIVAAEDDFFALPLYLKVILILLFTLLILFFIYYGFDKYSRVVEERKRRFKDVTREIVSFSNEITGNNVEKKEIKNIEKQPKENEDKKFVSGVRRDKELRDVRKVGPKINKVKKDHGEGFLFIE